MNWTGPKRFVDGVMSYLLNPQQTIKVRVDAGTSPMKALDLYLKDVNENFLKGSPMGGYDSEALLSTGQIYQDFMRTHSATLPENFSVTITGSFSNGKANLATSDIDVLVTDRTFEKYYKDIDKIINERLKQMGHVNSRLETHSTPDSFSLYDLAQVNPVTIKITKDSMTLQIFPPITVTSRDVSLAGKQYPSPDLYELFLRP
ncbi:MAG TPA: nucleotidyltransferase domain-containing protein [Bacteriovoracaceae bacterium]|nr:nucleotidyltransferase domain-containing protein [Bacteriovoracaceae bacterium]